MTDATPVTAPPGPIAQRLGHAGLLPFVFGALFAWLITHEQAHAFTVDGLAKYAAVIISFLGGIHWGLAFQRQAQHMQAPVRTHLVWGVLASLLAWPGMLMPAHAGLVWLALALIACYLVDRRLYLAAGVGRWLTLRFRLSAVAALSCLLAAGAV